MVMWLGANGGTLLVLALLLCGVAAILRALRRDRRRGKNACGAGCGGGCASCGACRRHQQ